MPKRSLPIRQATHVYKMQLPRMAPPGSSICQPKPSRMSIASSTIHDAPACRGLCPSLCRHLHKGENYENRTGFSDTPDRTHRPGECFTIFQQFVESGSDAFRSGGSDLFLRMGGHPLHVGRNGEHLSA